MEFVCHNLAETAKIAQLFIKRLSPPGRQALLVGLEGDLGSGKTAFTQLVARELGIKDIITSPTFVIEKKYKIPTTLCSQGTVGRFFHQLIHLDCYRLKSGQDLLNLDWREVIADPGNLVLMEWPEIVASILPPGYLEIKFEFIDDTTRKIILPWLKKR